MNSARPKKKSGLRKLFLALSILCFIYAGIYVINSCLGGYWLIPERDGRDRYSFGLSITDAILWQPRFGHEALGHLDYLGAAFMPLIRLDRRFIHPTIYFADEDFQRPFSQLAVSQIHPYWRDEFSTQITVSAVLNESNKMIVCKLQYAGSNHPREITEIRLRKKFAEAVGASPPAGFTAKPWVGIQTNRNEYDTRWVGSIDLPKNQDVNVNIPAKTPMAGKGHISFWYQRTDDSSPDFHNFSTVEFK